MNYNDLFSKSFPKELTLTFTTASGTTLATLTNENICQESMTLEGALCSDEDIRYGACEADCFRIRIAPTSNIYFEGSYLRVTMDIAGASSGNLIDADGNTLVDSEGDALSYYNSTDKVSITIGTYKVLSDMPTADRAWRDLTCYDLMYDIINADVTEWYKGLTFPMTLGDLRESLLTYLSIPFDSQTLINDDLEIKGSFAPDGALSAKTILEAAGELNGVFGHINGHTGKFEWISLLSGNGGSYPTEFDPATMTELKWYVDGSFTHERFEVAQLTGIIVYGEDGDIGDEYIRQDYGGILHPDAENTNPYVIKGNPLTFGLEGTDELYQAIGRLCGAIQDNVYVPYSIKTYGNPMMPLGRRIWVTDTRDNLYMTYVMKRYMTGIQMLMDEYSATGHKIYPSNINATQSVIKRTAGKVSYVEQKVEKIESYVGEWSGQGNISTTVTQMSNEYVLKVDSDGNIGMVRLSADPDTDMTSFDINADNITFKANSTLNMVAAKLNISSPNFSVTSNGVLTAKSGTIGGWTLGTNNFSHSTSITEGTAGTQYQILLNSPNNATDSTVGLYVRKRDYNGTTYGSWDNTFIVRYDGYFRAMGGGTIGPFSFSAGTSATASLRSGMTSLDDTTHNGVWLGSDGIALGKGNFKVTNAGALTAKSGTIGPFTIDATNGFSWSASTGGMQLYYNFLYFVNSSEKSTTVNATGVTTGGDISLYGNLITRGNSIKTIKAGTVVKTVTTAISQNIWTKSELNTLLGMTGVDAGNSVIYACNGDYSANSVDIVAVHWNGTNVAARFSSAPAAQAFRINYIIIVF